MEVCIGKGRQQYMYVQNAEINLEGQQGLWQQYNNQLNQCFCVSLELLSIVAAALRLWAKGKAVQ